MCGNVAQSRFIRAIFGTPALTQERMSRIRAPINDAAVIFRDRTRE